jgi:hypothetical protein
MKFITYALNKIISPPSYLHAVKRTAMFEALPEDIHDASLDPENGFPPFFQNCSINPLINHDLEAYS